MTLDLRAGLFKPSDSLPLVHFLWRKHKTTYFQCLHIVTPPIHTDIKHVVFRSTGPIYLIKSWICCVPSLCPSATGLAVAVAVWVVCICLHMCVGVFCLSSSIFSPTLLNFKHLHLLASTLPHILVFVLWETLYFLTLYPSCKSVVGHNEQIALHVWLLVHQHDKMILWLEDLSDFRWERIFGRFFRAWGLLLLFDRTVQTKGES